MSTERSRVSVEMVLGVPVAVASYYDVHVEGQVVADGAFTHRHPSPLARRIKGRVAFWKGIEVDTTRR